MKKLPIQQVFLNTYQEELRVIMYAFGGTCSKRQLLQLQEFDEKTIKELCSYNILKKVVIDRTAFIICKNSVYKHFNINQNYRLNAYNLKKSCLLAEYWLLCHNSTRTINDVLNKGNMEQYQIKHYTEYIDYLHSQGCYIRFTTDNPQTIHFVYFPKSQNPKTIAIFIKNFYNTISTDDNTIYKLSVRLNDKQQQNKVLKHIDGRYWYILDKLHFFTLNCPETLNIV